MAGNVGFKLVGYFGKLPFAFRTGFQLAGYWKVAFFPSVLASNLPSFLDTRYLDRLRIRPGFQNLSGFFEKVASHFPALILESCLLFFRLDLDLESCLLFFCLDRWKVDLPACIDKVGFFCAALS